MRKLVFSSVKFRRYPALLNFQRDDVLPKLQELPYLPFQPADLELLGARGGWLKLHRLMVLQDSDLKPFFNRTPGLISLTKFSLAFWRSASLQYVPIRGPPRVKVVRIWHDMYSFPSLIIPSQFVEVPSCLEQIRNMAFVGIGHFNCGHRRVMQDSPWARTSDDRFKWHQDLNLRTVSRTSCLSRRCPLAPMRQSLDTQIWAVREISSAFII